MAPDSVIADTVFVLCSPKIYNRPRDEVSEGLAALLQLPNFRVQNRQVLVRALDLFTAYPVAFGDALIVAAMEQAESSVLYSYDTDFDRFPAVTRVEP